MVILGFSAGKWVYPLGSIDGVMRYRPATAAEIAIETGGKVKVVKSIDPLFKDRAGELRRDFLPGDYDPPIDPIRPPTDWWERIPDVFDDIFRGRGRGGGGGGSRGEVRTPPILPEENSSMWERGEDGRGQRRRRRRINACNQKALKRALRRLCSFQKLVDRTWSMTSGMGPRRRRGTACPPRKKLCK